MPSLPLLFFKLHCASTLFATLGWLALHGEDDTSEGVGQTPEQQQQRASASRRPIPLSLAASPFFPLCLSLRPCIRV